MRCYQPQPRPAAGVAGEVAAPKYRSNNLYAAARRLAIHRCGGNKPLDVAGDGASANAEDLRHFPLGDVVL